MINSINLYVVNNKDRIKVCELFAGVGGFRLGLEGWKGKSATSGYKLDLQSNFEVVFSNQWEPSTKTQHASVIYEDKWGKEGHSNIDIQSLDVESIPYHDLIVGGFPCQDYSVATTLKNSKGLIGKKGVLWWSIHKILSESKTPPNYLFFENVDRLLISPSTQRGRDFAIILQSLNSLGYAVEWRVINAADFGFPQRRKRVFILGYKKGTAYYEKISQIDSETFLFQESLITKAFPVSKLDAREIPSTFQLEDDIVELSNNFNAQHHDGKFENAGFMIDGKVSTIKAIPNYEGDCMFLKDIVVKTKVESSFYINKEDWDKWQYLKGAKRETRKNSSGFEYNYSEGGMIFPDSLDKPSRTIITGEGGASASRFKHVISTEFGYRRLTPIELERLNMFPDNHTLNDSISDSKRAFLMGNALVIGVVERIGNELQNIID
jgi:DNA (cytosine-5)-methyltransferase 1